MNIEQREKEAIDFVDSLKAEGLTATDVLAMFTGTRDIWGWAKHAAQSEAALQEWAENQERNNQNGK